MGEADQLRAEVTMLAQRVWPKAKLVPHHDYRRGANNSILGYGIKSSDMPYSEGLTCWHPTRALHALRAALLELQPERGLFDEPPR